MLDDISFLVQETLKEAAKYSKIDYESEIPENCSGILFHVEKKTSTFVIRVKTCDDLARDYKEISENPSSFPSLRLEEDSKLSFFPCDSLQIAELIKRRFANKRFPMFEEHILNVSDPGDSWWMDTHDKGIRINLKLSRTNNIDQLVKLGPLGDAEDSGKTFSELRGYFQMLFSLGDFSSNSNYFEMCAEDINHPAFIGFKELLLNGEASYEFWEQLRCLENRYADSEFSESLKEANHFIVELSQLRSFWIEVQNQIETVS